MLWSTDQDKEIDELGIPTAGGSKKALKWDSNPNKSKNNLNSLDKKGERMDDA